jgi:hypothetical protein
MSESAAVFNPGRLWSLWEIMQRFRASALLVVASSLSRASVTLTVAGDDPAFDRDLVMNMLAEVGPPLKELPLSRVILDQFRRVEALAATGPLYELSILVRELNNNLIVELTSHCYLMIPHERRQYYEQKNKPFGERAAAVFPEAQGDMSAASRCFALDEWTACVFHLMRILEHGLHTLANWVGLPPEAMSYENWKNVIDQVEKKIREMEALPKGPDKTAKLQAFSEAASQFRYFKDAWRNHVSHSRVSYDQHTAPPVWLHVGMFIQHLANHAPEP